MVDLVANLDEVRTHEKEARALLAKVDKRAAGRSDCGQSVTGTGDISRATWLIIDVYVNVNS